MNIPNDSLRKVGVHRMESNCNEISVRRLGMLIESLLIVRFRTKRPVKVLRDGHGSSENKEKYRKSHLKIQKIIQNQFVCKSSSKVKVMSYIKLK